MGNNSGFFNFFATLAAIYIVVIIVILIFIACLFALGIKFLYGYI